MHAHLPKHQPDGLPTKINHTPLNTAVPTISVMPIFLIRCETEMHVWKYGWEWLLCVSKSSYFTYRCKDPQQHNWMTNSEREMCMWMLGVLKSIYLEDASLEDGKSTTLRVRASGGTFCKYYQSSKRRPCRSWQELIQVIDYTFDTVYCFQYAVYY